MDKGGDCGVCTKREHLVSQTLLLCGQPCLPVLRCSVNSCPCENTHGRPFCLLYV